MNKTLSNDPVLFKKMDYLYVSLHVLPSRLFIVTSIFAPFSTEVDTFLSSSYPSHCYSQYLHLPVKCFPVLYNDLFSPVYPVLR